MIIKKLILKGYKRLFLNHIDYLEYAPDKNMQIILGRNMSGKSQTLRQLNPLPANLKQEFYEEGYKHIEIEHNNKYYVLVSGLNGTNKHSFIVDGKELNDGGTRKVQLELVKDHFLITNEIMDILLNNTKFTSMSLMDRKKWLSELSTIDYTYSIIVFNKLRSRHRDITGGIKLIQEDIIKNENNVLTKEEIDKLKKDKEVLEEFYKHIVSLYTHIEEKIDTNIDLLSLNNKLESLLSNNLRGNLELKESEINKLVSEIKTLEEQIPILVKTIEELENIPEIKDIKELEVKLNETILQLESLYKLKKLNIKDELILEYFNIYSSIHTEIISILNQMLELERVRLLPKEEQTKILELETKLETGINTVLKRLELINTELTHLEKHKSDEYLIECPECKHKWHNGFNKENYEKLLKDKEEFTNRLKHYEEYKIKNSKQVEEIKLKDKLVNDFKELMISKLELKPLWEYIISSFDINKSSTYEIIEIFNKVNTELNNIKDVSTLLKNKIEYETIINNYKKNEELGKEKDKEKIKRLVIHLEELTKKKNEHNLKLEEIKKEFDILKQIKETSIKLKESLVKLNKNTKLEVIQIRNQYLTELSNFIKEEIVKIEYLINSQLQNESKLNKDKKLLEEYKQIEKVTSLMIKELSPNEGLIAKSINSFLNVFIQEMNSVINIIWTYDVELITCDITQEDDLDYKFKVKINNDEIIEDISKLSSSMKEIVDLAFRIVFAKYMKLKDVPLYLDEFGATFDSTHRTLAYSVIDKILTSDYPQVFMVCHYESIYGSLSNCDFNVLDTNNIELSKIEEYNKNLILN